MPGIEDLGFPGTWIPLPGAEGYPYGVEATGVETGVELHGGYETFAEADAVREALLREFDDYVSARVVKIETPETHA